MRGSRTRSSTKATPRDPWRCAQASSGSHLEWCGLGDSGSPRVASARRADTTEGCPARGRALSKPEGVVASSASRVNPSRASPRAKVSWRRGHGTARTGAHGATGRHSEIGTGLVIGSSSRASKHGAGGRHPRRGAPRCGAGVVERETAFALDHAGPSRCREAGDARSAPVLGRSKRATVNRPAPLFVARRANGLRRRDLRARSMMHERAPLVPTRGRAVDSLRRTPSRTVVRPRFEVSA